MASSSRRIKKNKNSAMEIDRLSALPETESLILKILDCLGLEEAAKTATLSKQWRFVWTNVPLAFREHSKDMEEIQRFVAKVNAALPPRRGSALHSLLVVFRFHERFTSDVNSWLDFAAQKHVKNLILSLKRNYSYDDGYILPHKYTLPQIIYSNPSLETLTLRNCIAVASPTRLEWQCLKSLSLEFVDLPQQVIGDIVSGCPVLNSLNLDYCVGFDRLEIGGRSFRWLNVSYCSGGDEHVLEISAPNVRHLKIGVSCVESYRRRRAVRLQNVQCVESAYIDVSAIDWLSIPMKMNPMMRNTTTQLLQQLGHVKTLYLSGSCTQVVSYMATNGCQFPQLMVEDLHMEAESYVHNIYGVVAMLESSPHLYNLVINGSKPLFEEDTMSWGPIIREFGDFFDSDNSGEPTLTLTRILLKRARVLEKMKICTIFSKVDTLLVKKTLINYPKTSTKVSVEITTF